MSVPVSSFIFLAFAVLAILGGAGVALHRNIVYSAFSLLASLIVSLSVRSSRLLTLATRFSDALPMSNPNLSGR